jgi:NitT/TauT family transport system substrate-binding protein
MKKIKFLIMIMTVLLVTSCSGSKEDKMVIATPFGPLAYPLMYMVDNHLLKGIAENVELKIWSNPDQLRAIVAGKQADFIALPANVAANLFNRGVDIKLLGVSLWSVMWIVSTDSTKKSLKDLNGDKILIGFKGDMPEILLNIVSSRYNLSSEKNFNLGFTATPFDAMNQLLIGNAENAVLSEPEVSYLTIESAAKNRKVYRVVDFQKEWGSIYGTGDRIPFGGIAVLSSKQKKRETIEKFIKEYKVAVEMCNENPSVLGSLIPKYFKGLKSEPNIEAMKHIKLEYISAEECRKDIEIFFKALLDFKPSLVGGKIPSDELYLKN